MGRHLDRNLGEASLSQMWEGKHLDHNLGEASQSLLWEVNRLDHNLGEASRPQPWGGISITYVRGVCVMCVDFVLENNSWIEKRKNRITLISLKMSCTHSTTMKNRMKTALVFTSWRGSAEDPSIVDVREEKRVQPAALLIDQRCWAWCQYSPEWLLFHQPVQWDS